MAIEIARLGDRYQVAVSPPEGPNWRSTDPLTATEVMEKLSELGCHPTDVTDAFHAVDPKWAGRHEAEVLRRREEAKSKQGGDPQAGRSRVTGNVPANIAALIDWLHTKGFAIIERREAGAHNRLLVLGSGSRRVQLLVDRGEWSLALSFTGEEWIHPDVWEAYLDRSPITGELSDIDHQAQFLQERLDEITAIATPRVEAELQAMGEAYMRKRLGLS